MSDLVSRCERCQKVTPFNKLIKIWIEDVRWDVCSWECAEAVEQRAQDIKEGRAA